MALKAPRMARLDLKLFHAYVNLAWRTVIHYLRKLNPFHTRFGIARFKANYVPEGLPWATVPWRELAHQAGRCTACGACDGACPIVQRGVVPVGHTAEQAALFQGPMALVLSGARAAPHLRDARADLDILRSKTCQECRACDRACPESIPIAGLAAGLLEQLAIIDESRGGAPGEL